MNLDICKEVMYNEGLTCVVADEDEIIFKSDKKGILPMLEVLDLYNEGKINPVYQADRIIGKAAIIIAHKCNIKNIYGTVISRSAYDFAKRKDINLECSELVEVIMDKAKVKEGPFEAALHEVDEDDFDLVLKIVNETLDKMKRNRSH